MPVSTCHCCGNAFTWSWEGAFDPLGYHKGVNSQTERIIHFLARNGYGVEVLHQRPNLCINDISKSGASVIIARTIANKDDPRAFFPGDLVAALDAAFPFGAVTFAAPLSSTQGKPVM